MSVSRYNREMPRLSPRARTRRGRPVRQMREPRGACPRTAGSGEAQQAEAAEETRPAVPRLRNGDEAGSVQARRGMDVVLRERLSLVHGLPERGPLRSNLLMLALPALYEDRPAHAPFPATDSERKTLPVLRRAPERSGTRSIARSKGPQPDGFFPLNPFFLTTPPIL